MHTEIHYYLYTALDGAPDVLETLAGIVPGDAWDFRPDPERFTLREVYKHLAIWDAIFLERTRQMLAREAPELPYMWQTVEELATIYATADPAACIAELRATRAEYVALLKSLTAEQWQRIGIHPRIGAVTIEANTTMVVGHDAYHTAQIAQWIRVAKGR